MMTLPRTAQPRTLPEPGGSRIRTTLRALRHRNFRLFIAGQFVSLIGTWMQSIAQSWLVYRLTGSSLLLGSIGFASQIQIFLLAPIGGTVADRYNRHRVILVTQTLSMLLAFVLAGLTLSGWVRVRHIFLLAALLGSVNAFDIPTRQAFAIDMVGREDLMNAIALNSSMFNGARIVGPAIAGLLVASIGEGWCFFVNGVSYVAVIIGLLMMDVRSMRKPEITGAPLNRILEGFEFVRRALPVRDILFLLGLVSLIGMPYSVLMPVFADRILHAGPGGLGILMGATGVGALFGALSLAARRGVRGLGRWAGYSCAGFGASLILFALSRSFLLSTTLLLPVGFFMMVQMASSNTLIQSMAPDRLRGRVMSVYSMVFIGMGPFGALFAGFFAERFGAPITVCLGAVACIAGAITFLYRIPGLREQARALMAAQSFVSGEAEVDDAHPSS
jgi:MFS family permease